MDLQAFANLVFWSDISLTLYNTTIKSVHFPEALAEPFWLGPICENLQVRAKLVQAIFSREAWWAPWVRSTSEHLKSR